MLPLEQGGVVDTNLRVYGLANVRVADSSVYPMQFASHVCVLLFARHVQRLDVFALTIGTARGPNLRSRRTGS